MKLVGEGPASEITSRTLSAHDFASPVTRAVNPFVDPSEDDPAFTFAVNRAMTVKTLRALADRIEKEEVVVQSARVLTLTNREEFTTSVLRLVMTESVKIAKESTG